MQKGSSSYQKEIPINPSPGNGVLGAKFMMAEAPIDLNCDFVKTKCVVAHLIENLTLISNCIRIAPLNFIVFEHLLEMIILSPTKFKELTKITNKVNIQNSSIILFPRRSR